MLKQKKKITKFFSESVLQKKNKNKGPDASGGSGAEQDPCLQIIKEVLTGSRFGLGGPVSQINLD
jgi:hypothetical protein